MFSVFIKYIEYGENVLKHLMEVVEIYLISDMIVKKKDLKVHRDYLNDVLGDDQ